MIVLPTPEVHFDKTRWTIDVGHIVEEQAMVLFLESFKHLFTKTGYGLAYESRRFHRSCVKYKGPHNLIIYYDPILETRPYVCLASRPVTSKSLSTLTALSGNLRDSGFQPKLSEDHISLAVDWKHPQRVEDPAERTWDSVMNNLKRRRNAGKLSAEILDDVDQLVLDWGFFKSYAGRLATPEESNYELFQRFRTNLFGTDLFQINISYQPLKPFLPYAHLQIDHFPRSRDERAYFLLLFVLRCLRLFSSIVRCAEVELAYDFPIRGSGSVVLPLLSSIHARKLFFGWSNKRDEPIHSYYELLDEEILEKATHYIGHRTDKDYQLVIYPLKNWTRLELRLRRGGQGKMGIKSVRDLFTQPWPVEFWDNRRITLARAVGKSSLYPHYHLAGISLLAFIHKIPKRDRINLRRDFLELDRGLRETLETSAYDFHLWTKDLFEVSGVIVIPFGLGARNLKQLFKDLPSKTSSKLVAFSDSLRFFLRDADGRLLAKIWIGRLSPQLIAYGTSHWSIERLQDVIWSAPAPVNVDPYVSQEDLAKARRKLYKTRRK